MVAHRPGDVVLDFAYDSRQSRLCNERVCAVPARPIQFPCRNVHSFNGLGDRGRHCVQCEVLLDESIGAGPHAIVVVVGVAVIFNAKDQAAVPLNRLDRSGRCSFIFADIP